MIKKEAFPGFSKKHPYLLCVVSILFCMVLLTGATFAWYSDSISSTGNRIQAGNLDVTFTMGTLNEAGTDLLSDTEIDLSDVDNKIFNETAFGPGMSGTRYLKVSNAGSMPLRYKAIFTNRGDEIFSGTLQFKMTRIVFNGQKETTTQEQSLPGNQLRLCDVVKNDQLASQNYDIYELTYRLPEDVNNDCNTADALFEMDVALEANQVNAPTA